MAKEEDMYPESTDMPLLKSDDKRIQILEQSPTNGLHNDTLGTDFYSPRD